MPENNAEKAEDKSIITDILARLDRIPWFSWHLGIFLIIFFGGILEGYTISLGGVILGALIKQFKLGTFYASLLTPLFLTGALIGSFYFGSLSDKIGRKKTFVITLTMITAGSLIAAFSFNYYLLALGGVTAATGAEGEVVVSNTILTEFANPKNRGLTVTSGNTLAFDIGTVIASVVAYISIMTLPSNLGWRTVFFFVLLLSIFVFLARLKLPESVRFLIKNNKLEEAEKTVSIIEKRYEEKTGKKLSPVTPEKVILSTKKGSKNYMLLFKKYPKRAVLASILNFTEVWPYYAAFSIIPVILTKFFGVSASNVSLALIYITVAGVLGLFLMSFMLDLIGRRKTIIISYSIAAILLFTTGFITPFLNLFSFLALLTILYFWVYTAAGVLYPQVAEMFPTEIRSTAIGTATGIGRLGGIIGPIILAIILMSYSYLESVELIFIISALVVALGAISEGLLGPELRGKRLESIL